MNLYVAEFKWCGKTRFMLIESEWSNVDAVRMELHPAIADKNPSIEFVGECA